MNLPLLATPGQYSLSATFVPQSSFQGSSTSTPFGVSKLGTTLVLNPTTPNVPLGNIVATLSDNHGNALVGKTVFFIVTGGANPFGLAVATDFSGKSRFIDPGLAPGFYTVSAYFSGAVPAPITQSLSDAQYLSSSTSLAAAEPTATMTSISAPTITYNANGSVTVMVSSTAGTVTGNVSLSVDGGTTVSKALTRGSATFTSSDIGALASPTAGDHPLNATYAAQGYFLASSAEGTLHVNTAATTTSISAPRITYNANGSVTVTESSTAGTVTGSVSLSVDGGTAVSKPLTGGSATFTSTDIATLSSLGAGDHSLSAIYAAQGNFSASSIPGTLHVNAAATTTSISAPTITYNANGSVTVMVSSTAGTVTGKVSLSVDGGTAVSRALTGGSATFTSTDIATLSSLGAGNHTLNATYAAQGNFSGSSATGTLQVNRAPTITAISAPTITYGVNGTVTVTVSSGAGTVTGNVSLSVDGGTAIVKGLSSGSATFTKAEIVSLSSLSAGNHSLNASYAAQGNFLASSTIGTLNVNQASTTTAITAPTINYDANGSVTVKVTSSAGPVTGNVSLSVDGGTAVSKALSSGSATFGSTDITALAYPSVGDHSLSANYSAQGNFAGSSATGSLHVNLATVVLNGPLALNGSIKGGVQLLAGNPITLNSGSSVAGDLIVVGTPKVVLNGTGKIQGTIVGSGNAQPSGYAITLNNGTVTGNLRTRVNPISMPTVAAPPAPTGTRNVSLNRTGQSPGDFATLRNLTLNANVGNVAIPPGNYGNFVANSASGFILGVAGSAQPATYYLQNLTMNSVSQLQVVGPVVVVMANGVTLNGAMGASSHPEWLQLNIACGGLTLNGGSTLAGLVTAPKGTVTLNTSTTLTGAVACNQLTVNTGGIVQGTGK